MSTFPLEIVTPDKIVFSGSVEMITAPSALGTIGILPQHIPLFANLVEGEVKISKEGKEYFLAIGKGFIEVTKEKTSILVTEAYKAEELNEQEILKAKQRAEWAMKNKSEGITYTEAQALFQRSSLALKVLNRQRRTNKGL